MNSMAAAWGAMAQRSRRVGLRAAGWGLAAALSLTCPTMAVAQASPGSPAIDSDLVRPGAAPVSAPPTGSRPPSMSTAPGMGAGYVDPTAQPRYMTAPANGSYAATASSGGAGCTRASSGDTYHQDDLIGAAENAFGDGAHGLAIIIRDILRKQGEPNGYITGREASGAFAVGLRYGSGMLCDKAIGRMPIYWTGPSLGFDIGGSASKTFVLVYNLTKADDLFRRFAAGEGQAYLVGGFHVSYLRHGNVVLIPVRMGVGLRLGVNGGYMKITRHLNYMPF